MSEYQFTCKHCGQVMSGTQEMLGKTCACPSCGQEIKIQDADVQPSAPPTPTIPQPVIGKTAGIAITSLVLGILSFVLFFLGILLSIPGVICGHIAKSRISKSAGALKGDGLALAGIIIGYVNIGFAVLFVPLNMAIAIPAFIQYRDDTRTGLCQNNLRLIDHAKEVWSVKVTAATGDDVDDAEVIEYLQGGRPVCPDAGTYTFNPVGSDPVCSKGGEHSLP
jgi:hypothetical protein